MSTLRDRDYGFFNRYIREIWHAPSLRDLEDAESYGAASAAFAAAVTLPANRRLFDWWLDEMRRDDRIPAYDSRWHVALADIAHNLFSREWSPERHIFRYRYVGASIVKHAGLQDRATEGTPVNDHHPIDAELWAYNRILFEDLVPTQLHFDYAAYGRPNQMATALELPLRAPGTEDVRFVLSAIHFHPMD